MRIKLQKIVKNSQQVIFFLARHHFQQELENNGVDFDNMIVELELVLKTQKNVGK